MPGVNPPQESNSPDNSRSVETEPGESTKDPTPIEAPAESLTTEENSETPGNPEQHITPPEALSPEHGANMSHPPPYQYPPNQYQTVPMGGVEQYGLDQQGSGQYPGYHPAQNPTFGPGNPYQQPAGTGLNSNSPDIHDQQSEPPRASLGATLITTVSGFLSGGQQSTQQVETARARAAPDYASLTSLNNQLVRKLKKFEAQYNEDGERLRSYETRIELMAEALKAAEEKNNKMERRVTELRGQIYAMVTGSGPVKDDSYYQGEFNSLSCLIEKEMRKFSRTHNDCVLADDVADSVFELVGTLGDPGRICCETLKSSEYQFELLYKQRSLRVVLLRHIVALYLFHHIFEPFAFGLPDETSHAFKLVDKDAIVNESQFSNTLMIHQANGRTANKICAKITQSKEKFVETELGKTLQMLLPLTPTPTLTETVGKFVTTAVKLKQTMTVEYGLYYPEWILPGTNFEEEFMEAKDEVDKGFVVMCVFPGLVRKAKMEPKILTFTIVKPRVMLK